MAEPGRRQSVLVVDDSFTNRKLLRKILDADFCVIEAENGLAALARLRENPEMAAVVLDLEMPELDGFGVLNAMREDGALREIPVVVDTIVDDVDSQLRALDCGAVDVLIKPFNPQIALHRVRNIIARRETQRQTERARMLEELLRQSEIDEKTGLWGKHAFCRKAAALMAENPDVDYVILRWDVDHFKVYNDIFGVAAGDRYLARIGEAVRPHIDDSMVLGHWEADHFVACLRREDFDPQALGQRITRLRADRGSGFEFFIRLGVYEVTDRSLAVELMCDRALLALHSVKGNFTERMAYYRDSMRTALLEEQEILGEMGRALDEGQFVVYLQPQINYASGALVGAEALVRWRHPEKGLIPPGKFIPIFEQNGFVSRLDQYVCTEACRLLRAWIDRGLTVVPLSVNISRRDIYDPGLCRAIEANVKRFDLPPSLLRLEITESAYMENGEQLIKIVDELRALGFAVEMDDFGSGYSSLNTLKAVPVDKLKLDIKFLESDSSEDGRGGSILSSIVRMASWLKLPVIAEGVETQDQAEYLKSIGCLHMQGYYFARPMPAGEFADYLGGAPLEAETGAPVPAGLRGAADFLSASTQATLLFNSFVGGAAIVEYDGSRVEALRLNDRYFDVVGVSREDYEPHRLNLLGRFDEENAAVFLRAVEAAVTSGRESECELHSLPLHGETGDIWTCVRLRLLAKNEERCILYLAVENITKRVALAAHLSDILSSVPAGILDFRIEESSFRITYFNDRTADMFGFSGAEYSARFAAQPLEAVYPDDRERVYAELWSAFSAGESALETSYRHLCADGGFRWVEIAAHVVRRRGDAAYISAILQDIDRDTQTAQMLRWQGEKLRLLGEAAAVATFDYEPGADVLRLSLPVPEQGLAERVCTGFLGEARPGAAEAAFPAALRRACGRAESGTCGVEDDFGGGGPRRWRAAYVSLADGSGRVYRVVGRLDPLPD